VLSHSLELDGATIHLEERGEGRPLVLLHGGLGSSAYWDPVVDELAGSFRVITPDSRGHGRSTNPAGELSYARLADDVAALIGALELRRPVVGGWSDGGQVALELGVRHPGVAGALIAGAAYPDFDAGVRRAHRSLLSADDAGVPDLEALETLLGEYAEEMKALHRGGAKGWYELVTQTAPMWLDYEGLRPDQLESIQAPVLVLAADRDELIPVELAVSLFRALPDAELAVCPWLHHAGLTPERAEIFAGLIRDFAQRHT
jgi:pimeloyl-ACP methyl ester carboxylesterase